MKDVNAIAKRAMEYKEKGLSEKEIADELHLSAETVTWLLTRGVKGGEPPKDVKIGWRSVGVFGNRIGFMAAAMSDIALEELEKRQMDADSIVGIAINGIPLAAIMSEELERADHLPAQPGTPRERRRVFVELRIPAGQESPDRRRCRLDRRHDQGDHLRRPRRGRDRRPGRRPREQDRSRRDRRGPPARPDSRPVDLIGLLGPIVPGGADPHPNR